MVKGFILIKNALLVIFFDFIKLFQIAQIKMLQSTEGMGISLLWETFRVGKALVQTHLCWNTKPIQEDISVRSDTYHINQWILAYRWPVSWALLNYDFGNFEFSSFECALKRLFLDHKSFNNYLLLLLYYHLDSELYGAWKMVFAKSIVSTLWLELRIICCSRSS